MRICGLEREGIFLFVIGLCRVTDFAGVAITNMSQRIHQRATAVEIQSEYNSSSLKPILVCQYLLVRTQAPHHLQICVMNEYCLPTAQTIVAGVDWMLDGMARARR